MPVLNSISHLNSSSVIGLLFYLCAFFCSHLITLCRRE